jgi:hypothetical protein
MSNSFPIDLGGEPPMDGVEIVEKESADARRGRATDLAGEGSRGVDSIDTIRWRPGAASDPVLMPTGAGGDASNDDDDEDAPSAATVSEGAAAAASPSTAAAWEAWEASGPLVRRRCWR